MMTTQSKTTYDMAEIIRIPSFAAVVAKAILARIITRLTTVRTAQHIVDYSLGDQTVILMKTTLSRRVPPRPYESDVETDDDGLRQLLLSGSDTISILSLLQPKTTSKQLFLERPRDQRPRNTIAVAVIGHCHNRPHY